MNPPVVKWQCKNYGWLGVGHLLAIKPKNLLLIPLLLFTPLVCSLQAQNLIISEFLAANSSGERDEDGDYSDWIEIYNADVKPASLTGWYLSNDEHNLMQWQFPAVTIPGQGFLVVFSSGKDRKDPKGKLHTNFKLAREGEFLALIRPDGHSIASGFAPAYPQQVSDAAYGRSLLAKTEILVPFEASGRLMVPDDDRLGRTWTTNVFNDASWMPITMGIGYVRSQSSDTNVIPPVTSLVDVTKPGDVIVPTSSNSPGNEGVGNAIDNNPNTKYLNFDKLNAGLTVTLSAGIAVVNGLRLTSANDAPERDPTTYLLLGSNDGQAFTEIARAKVPDFTGRFTPVTVTFSNNLAFSQYRLLFPTVRNAAAAVAVQIAEIELLGRTGPAPPRVEELVKTDVESLLYGRRSSVYLRLPFVAPEVRPRERLALRVRYDGGFTAWLNGVEVAHANVPNNVTYNSLAVTNRAPADAAREERFDLSFYANLIRPGANVLAIQGLNDRIDSPAYLLQAQLDNTEVILGDNSYFASPTPGSLNAQPSQGLVSEVVVDRPRGFYETPIEVAMICATEGATIRYTTNASAPSKTNGVTYAGPLRIGRTTTLRAAAFRESWLPSRILTHTYLFLNDVISQNQASALAQGFPATWSTRAADYGMDPRVIGPNGQDKYGGKYTRSIQADLQSIPSMSIVMDVNEMFGPQGIYSNPEMHGEAWERGGSLELIYPDNRPGFQEDAGLRIQGGAFRRFDLTLKKSFRVIFREKYGDSLLHYPLFGTPATDLFNNFVLRANSNDGWPYGGGAALYVRDAFAQETARAMGMVASHSAFVHLYINGMYWGLYNPVERPDAAFSAAYHGGDRATWDAINQDSVPDGTYDAWNRMLAQLNQGMAGNEAYQRIQGNNPDGTRNPNYEDLLDVDNLIDYMILNIFAGNSDWPGRNWWVGRNRDNGDGFHFYPWDTETSLGMTGLDANVTGVTDAVARPYAALRANAEFRLRFGDHVFRHFFHGGALYVNPTNSAWNPAKPENNRPAARFSAVAGQVSRAMVGESARWGDQFTATPYTRDEHWQKSLDSLLTGFFPSRSAKVLTQLRQASLYPPIDPPVMNQHGGQVPRGFKLAMSAAAGTIYYTTNGSDPRIPVTSVPNNAMIYKEPVVLNDLLTIKTRVLNGTAWSALNEAAFVVGDPVLAISEIHYHPAKPADAELAAGFADADEFEFIELFNPGVGTYDLNGVSIVSGVRFDFTGSVITNLPAGAYVLVVKNRAAFDKRYGSGLPIAGEYSGRLDNAGERVEVVNARGESILNFIYGAGALWPQAADGAGPSLEPVNPLADLNSPGNWRASLGSGGSPGQPNPIPPPVLAGMWPAAGQLRFHFDGRAGLSCTLYYRDSFATGAWQVLQRVEPVGANLTIESSVPISLDTPARFYRISIP